ncbi:MAG: lysophospholipid acyltransferase family protein [Alphaproteobacteria bacterium]
MTVLRSALFYLGAFVLTAVTVVAYLPLLVAPQRVMMAGGSLWSRAVLALLAGITGLGHRVRGRELIPDGPVIFASKHQSAWDTFAFPALSMSCSLAIKKELFLIPFYGWYARHAGMIGIDRGGGARALRSLLRGARATIGQGRSVIIFPEGTRVAAGQHRRYQPGIAALYKDLECPVVPVAVNSGLFWGRRAFVKQPGTITLEFLAPIAPGLARDEFMAELERRIETATRRLEAEVKSESGAASSTS